MSQRSPRLLKAGPLGSAFLLCALAGCATPSSTTNGPAPVANLADNCHAMAQKLGKLKPGQAVSVDGGQTADMTVVRLSWATPQGNRSTVCRFKDGQLRQIDGQAVAP